MTGLLRRIDRFWYMPAPAERLAVLRILVGSYALAYLLIRFLHLISVARFDASAFEPVGPVRMLSAPLPVWAVSLLVTLACVSGGAFVLGWFYRFNGPLFAALFLWVTSYRSSWGMIFHTENLVALHLSLLAFAPAADVLGLDARTDLEQEPGERTSLVRWKSGGTADEGWSGRYGWALRAICAVTAATYLLAGIAKLRLAGPSWMGGDVLRAQVAYDNLRKIELGSFYSPLGAWLVRYSWPFRLLAALSMLLELGAPLALIGGRIRTLWVLGAFSFHVGVAAVMAIAFPYQLSFVAYAAYFPLERLVPPLQRWRARFS